MREPDLPARWICNLTKHHEDDRKANDDSPDSATKYLECFCVECVELNPILYEISNPVCTPGHTEEYMSANFVGIWFTEEGWRLHIDEQLSVEPR